MKLDALKFALSGGIYAGACVALATIASMLNIPGFPQFTKMLTSIYEVYGYSVSGFGILTGAFWGFIEGFVHVGVFALIYNKLVSK